uniref:Uncharacterized protein n=1 Tax=Anguilla anguilla TaxID=7936 RepID=A0A0E9VB88_ANGAN
MEHVCCTCVSRSVGAVLLKIMNTLQIRLNLMPSLNFLCLVHSIQIKTDLSASCMIF